MAHRLPFLTKRFTSKSQGSGTVQDSGSFYGPREKKGPFGLTTLYPRHSSSWDALSLNAHIIFVHGLGGGSEHTWTNDSVFWPRDLLPHEKGFENVTTHSFGYDSDFKKSNVLNVDDFSRSLLASLEDHQYISDSPCPIVLVGHSMGGLVIKRAYIIAKESSRFSSLASRIRSMCFIATPHQGSDHAAFLSSIFRLTGSLKPYLDDLNSNSEEVKAINEKFPRFSKDLELHSFYESQALTIPGVGKRIIVEKTNAVLALDNERGELLNGDHRSICKFRSAQDTNYIRIHETLKRTIEIISKKQPRVTQDPHPTQSEEAVSTAQAFLASAISQEDDLNRLVEERTGGSCEWLKDHDDYKRWQSSGSSSTLWIRGPPAAGKSVLAAYAVEELPDDLGSDVCYYFFVKSDKSRASIFSFLQSMASQVASFVPDVQSFLVKTLQAEPELAKTRDHRPLWNKIWRRGILKILSNSPVGLVWVVDSFDECEMDTELAKLFVSIQQCPSIRMLVTARQGHDNYPAMHRYITALDLRIEDTQKDIEAYLDEHLLPSEPDVRAGILRKSNGCFLWATLVVRRLKNVNGLQARLRAIKDEPPGIQDLYAKIARSLPNHRVSRTILTWIVCATRPLSLGELRYVLPEVNEEDDEDAVREAISRNCHDLVYVDQNKRVQARHSSARDFLIYREVQPGDRGITIDRSLGHKTLALGCLGYLTSSEMTRRGRRKMSLSRTRSPFAAYATDALYVHLNGSPAQDEALLEQLSAFLQSETLLTWIAFSARKGNLETVLRTAQALKDFLRRKSKTDLLLGEEVVVIDCWANDLVKLVSKFSRQLSLHPSSIYDLIPPFCPRDSAPFQQFANQIGRITVRGLLATAWDDCLCTITLSSPRTENASNAGIGATAVTTRRSSESSPQVESLRSVASTPSLLAVGTSLGRIALFNDSTYLEERTIEHRRQIKFLQFAPQQSFLACASNRLIQVWNTKTWQSISTIKISKDCLDLAFVDDDQILLAALNDNSLIAWNLRSNTIDQTLNWAKRLEHRYGAKFRARFPSAATFNTDMDTLAVVYRAQDIVLWNYEENTLELYNHEEGLSNGTTEPMTSVNSLVFSQSPTSSLLVASYNIGDLVLFDVRSKAVKARLARAEIYFRLCAAPDGRTFAAAANDGTIDLYDFETLKPIYRIRSKDRGITTLTFNHDSARLYDIRGDGRSCLVWEPASLLRRDLENSSLRTPSTYSQDSYKSVTDYNDSATPTVTALACHNVGMYFVGKDDGTVSLFDPSTGAAITILFSHVSAVVKLEYHTTAASLISVDTGGYLLMHSIHEQGTAWYARRRFDHHSSGTGIQHFIFKHDRAQDRLLICANDEARLITVPGKKILGLPVRCDSEVPYIWARHPSNANVLLLVHHHRIYIYSWEHLSALTTDRGIAISADIDSDMRIRGIVPMLGDSVLALSYSYPGPRPQQKLLVISASTLRADCNEVNPILGYQAVCDQMAYHVGALRGLEIFLNINGWICSANKNTFDGQEEIVHYFSPPTDWLRGNYEYIIKVTDLSDLLFAWRGEVALVREGLSREHDLKDPRDV